MGMIKNTENEALLPLLFADIDAIKIMKNDSNGSIVGCELIDPAIHVTSGFGINNCKQPSKTHPIVIGEVRSKTMEYQSWWDDF